MLLSKSGLYLTKFDVLDCLWIFIFIVLSFAKRWQAVFGSSGESNPELRPFVCPPPSPARAGKIMDISYVPIKQLIKNIPRIGKLPYGAKRGFIDRKALLKKGFIEIKALLK